MTTTTPTPTPPPAPDPLPMDPRIRERRIEVKRAVGRRRMRALIVAGSVIVAAGLVFLVVNSPFLDVDRVEIVGAKHLTSNEVRAAARVHRHDALLFVHADAAARRLESLPWVERASVRREFPGTVRIVITEYVPVAYVRAGTGAVLLAENGRAIARVSAPAPSSGIEIRGVRRAPTVGELLSPPEAAGIVPQLPPALAQQTVAVNVGGNGIALDLARGGAIRLGDASDLDAKAAAALAVLARNGSTSFAYIDVSTPDTPVLG